MKIPKWTIAPAVIAVLAILFLVGPRVSGKYTLRPLSLPDDLDAYLRNEESRFQGMTPGTEKTIFWATPEKRKTPLSFIYLHGFTATRQETSPLFETIAREAHANIFFTRLTGHGLGTEAMKDASLDAWINDAWEAMEIGRRIGERVVVAGVSNGAPLAAWLATRDVKELAALVLISPNFMPADPSAGLILLPWGNLIVRLAVGKYNSFKPLTEKHALYWTTRYRSEALLAMMGVIRMASGLPLEKIDVPVLCLYTENDKAISLPAMREAFGRIGGGRKDLVDLKEAKDHVLAGDAVSPETTDRAAAIIREFLAKNGFLR